MRKIERENICLYTPVYSNRSSMQEVIERATTHEVRGRGVYELLRGIVYSGYGNGQEVGQGGPRPRAETAVKAAFAEVGYRGMYSLELIGVRDAAELERVLRFLAA